MGDLLLKHEVERVSPEPDSSDSQRYTIHALVDVEIHLYRWHFELPNVDVGKLVLSTLVVEVAPTHTHGSKQTFGQPLATKINYVRLGKLQDCHTIQITLT